MSVNGGPWLQIRMRVGWTETAAVEPASGEPPSVRWPCQECGELQEITGPWAGAIASRVGWTLTLTCYRCQRAAVGESASDLSSDQHS